MVFHKGKSLRWTKRKWWRNV